MNRELKYSLQNDLKEATYTAIFTFIRYSIDIINSYSGETTHIVQLETNQFILTAFNQI